MNGRLHHIEEAAARIARDARRAGGCTVAMEVDVQAQRALVIPDRILRRDGEIAARRRDGIRICTFIFEITVLCRNVDR